jgi:hypothetical protein
MVSKRFDFGAKGPTVVKNFKSDWKMTWSDTTIQSPSIIFEICNFLFNYVILNFNQAAMFLQNKQGVEQYKNALQKLQSVGSFLLGNLGIPRASPLQPAAPEPDEAPA